MRWTAPAGHHAVTIYTVAPNVIQGAACVEKHVPGLAEATRTRVIVTPADFRRRVRQHHHSFAASQSESGGGVQGVMKGARAAVRAMREQ